MSNLTESDWVKIKEHFSKELALYKSEFLHDIKALLKDELQAVTAQINAQINANQTRIEKRIDKTEKELEKQKTQTFKLWIGFAISGTLSVVAGGQQLVRWLGDLGIFDIIK